MTAEKRPSDSDTEPSFAEMLDAYTLKRRNDVQTGEKIKGTIIAIGRDNVFVDCGTKVDAVVNREELLDEDGRLPYQVGDLLELFVIAQTEGEIRLSKAMSGIGGLQMIREAFENQIPVEAKVKAVVKGGLEVELLQRRAFCPISQIDVDYVEHPEDLIGQSFPMLITRFEEKGRNIVVSRRNLLQQTIDKERRAFFESAAVGDVLQGTVTKLMPYGAFVSLAPGVEGLVHISELDWSRMAKVEDIVAVGDDIKVKILAIKDRDQQDQKKIELSVKQTNRDPWESVHKDLSQGMVVNGKVTRCTQFGIFVEVRPGVEGLVHISEISYFKRVVHPADEVRQGQTVAVSIKEMDIAHRRLSLSMKDAEGDPWLDIGDQFSAGQKVQGRLEKKAPFGYFITLKPGVTGLLPKSKIHASGSSPAFDRMNEGAVLPVVIEAIQPSQRRITLAPANAEDEGDWQPYAAKESPDTAMGDFGQKLKQALERKRKRGEA